MPTTNTQPTTIFFDLDGTLTDPKIGITRCIQHALRELGLEVPKTDELTWCIGPPLQASLATLAGEHHAAQALALFRERFADVGWKENLPYPLVRDLLEQLANKDYQLFVATSKPYVYARRIIEHFGFAPYFSEVFGSELDGTRTDKGELLRFALETVSSSDRATMVGDRLHDIAGARENGLRSIGVTYGYGSREELEAAGAHHIVSTPVELWGLLQ